MDYGQLEAFLQSEQFHGFGMVGINPHAMMGGNLIRTLNSALFVNRGKGW
jgi:hypothetical protein